MVEECWMCNVVSSRRRFRMRRAFLRACRRWRWSTVWPQSCGGGPSPKGQYHRTAGVGWPLCITEFTHFDFTLIGLIVPPTGLAEVRRRSPMGPCAGECEKAPSASLGRPPAGARWKREFAEWARWHSPSGVAGVADRHRAIGWGWVDATHGVVSFWTLGLAGRAAGTPIAQRHR